MTIQHGTRGHAPGRRQHVVGSPMAVPTIGLDPIVRLVRAAAVLTLTVWTALVVGAGPHPWATATVGVLAVTTLWVQPRHPLVTLAAAFGGLAVIGMLGFPGPDDPLLVLLLWSSYGVGRHAPREHQPWVAAAVLFFLSINVLNDDVHLPGDLVFPVLFTAVPWTLGLAVQLARTGERHAREEAVEVLQAQEVMMRDAAEQERLRIARELHDVAAHAMSAVSLQAQVLRRRIESGTEVTAGDARQLEVAARHALDELRHVVGVLRPVAGTAPLAPQPSLEDLDALIAECRAAGQRVRLRESGRRQSISAGLSLCAYRIVQEALANARQHSAPGVADVTVAWSTESVTLRVASLLGGLPTTGRPGAGHGLIGMHERAALFGGDLHAGAEDDGNWVVEARLPLATLGRPS